MMSGDDLTKQSASGWESRVLAEMPVAFFVTDAVGKVTLWNGKMEELTGRPAKDVLGKRSWAGFFDKKRSTPVDLAIASEEEETDESFVVTKADCKSQVAFNARPICSEDGRVLGVIATLQGQGGAGALDQFVAAAKHVAEERDAGNIDAEIDVSQFHGPLSELAELVN